MEGSDLSLNFGMLCCCCDYRSFQLPDVEGFTVSQRQMIEELCKLCLDASRRSAVNG